MALLPNINTTSSRPLTVIHDTPPIIILPNVKLGKEEKIRRISRSMNNLDNAVKSLSYDLSRKSPVKDSLECPHYDPKPDRRFRSLGNIYFNNEDVEAECRRMSLRRSVSRSQEALGSEFSEVLENCSFRSMPTRNCVQCECKTVKPILKQTMDVKEHKKQDGCLKDALPAETYDPKSTMKKSRSLNDIKPYQVLYSDHEDKFILPPIVSDEKKKQIENPKAFIEEAIVRRKGFCASNLKLKINKKKSKKQKESKTRDENGPHLELITNGDGEKHLPIVAHSSKEFHDTLQKEKIRAR